MKPTKLETLPERFAKKIRKTATCWLWTGSKDTDGYGQIGAGNRIAKAHHIAWELANNAERPKGMVIDHLCDNPACVNPAHLKMTTHQDNISRRTRKAIGYCANGHERSPENTRWKVTRICKPCEAANKRRHRKKLRTGTGRLKTEDLWNT